MISIQTLDRKIWRKDLLTEYLYKCSIDKMPAVIDLTPEGPCAENIGLYRLLDDFCIRNNYGKHLITVQTGNMLETHSEYNIVRVSGCFYEIKEIQHWLKGKSLPIRDPIKHFANFISRGNWGRLWLATILNKHHDKTIQTYHYSQLIENYNANGYVGLDDLVRFNCNIISDVVQFLQSCPRTLDIEYLNNLENSKDSIYQHANSYYPIQHPSNLNLLQYYSEIFVDIVSETNLTGNCFFITEKTWRPIIAKRPFIVLSNVKFLENLRKLGFKTFNDFWSEEYDLYGEQHRIEKIEKLIEQLALLSCSDLVKMLNDMQAILDHNYQTFINLTTEQISEVFNV